MQVLAFVTQKGGTGKSTLAASLAVAASEAGEKVAILDMDPQGSLLAWRGQRERVDIEVIATDQDLLVSTLFLLERKGVGLCIIDTEGAGSEAARAAMSMADLCIIPVRPNAFDLWASDMTRRTVRSMGREAVFLLNQCPPLHQGQRVQAGVKALETAGALLSPVIVSRVDYQDAGRRGAGVTELNRSGAAAEEMRLLWASVARRMNLPGATPLETSDVPEAVSETVNA